MEYTTQWNFKHFTELTALEYHSILELRTSVFVVEQKCPYQEIDQKDLSSYHVWGAIENEIVAVSRIVEPGISYVDLSIGRVAVKSEYRGTHISRDLMNQSLSFINSTLGEQPVRISAQEHLQTFYHKFGFKTVGSIYLEDAIPHIEMIRE